MIVFGGFDGTRRNEVWALSFSGTPTWSSLATSGTGPSPRYNHTAIFDPVRDRMIVFGGDDGADLNDVWALSLSGTPAWSLLSPSGTAPQGRYSHSAIYDASGDRMIVFGGKAGTSLLNDTWALSLSDPPAWSDLMPTDPPSTRYRHSAIYDPVRVRMVVYGGDDGSNDYFDTRYLPLTGTPAWSPIIPNGPSPARREHVAIYDPVGDRMVVHGGDSHGTETWVLPFAGTPSWSQLSPVGVISASRDRHAGVHDPLRNRLIVFGGENGLNDVEALVLTKPATWEELLGPDTQISPRYSHTATYDPVRDRLLVVSGNGSNDDVWALSLGGPPAWSRATPGGLHFNRRHDHTAIYDPLGDRLIVFGGYVETGTGTIAGNDTWSLSIAKTFAWSPLAALGAPPSARFAHVAIYDPVRRRMIVFGGRTNSATYPNETKALSLTGTQTWSQLVVSGTPPLGRSWASAVYDPVRDRMIVFGGDDGTSARNDIWALSLGGSPTWSQLTPTNALAFNVLGHSAFYDPIRDRMVFFGGSRVGTPSGYGSDAWALSLSGPPTWSQLVPSGNPPSGRNHSTATYDAVRDRMVVFGGISTTFFGDAWFLDWGSPSRPSVSCPGDLIWTAGAALEADYALTNSLATERAVEWKLESTRQWPGFPLRGVENIGGAATETLTVQVPVPDTAAAGSNLIRLSIAFAGALGYENACDHLMFDTTTPSLASLVSAQAEPGRARVAWHVTANGPVTVQRRGATTPWTSRGQATPDGSGVITHEDRSVMAGERYGYRLAWREGDREVVAGEVWVEVPRQIELALHGVRPNPSAGEMAASLTLPHAGRVDLELYDVRGRRMDDGEPRLLGAGHHVLPIRSSRLAPGIYVVRLGFGGRTLQTRAVVVR